MNPIYIIFPSMPRSYKWFLPFRLPNQNLGMCNEWYTKDGPNKCWNGCHWEGSKSDRQLETISEFIRNISKLPNINVSIVPATFFYEQVFYYCLNSYTKTLYPEPN
jgi:hypothetical protein